MSECARTRELCRKLEALGALTYPLVAGEMCPPGWPDRYVCDASWRGFLEFKEGARQLAPAQRHVIEQLRARGEQAWVIRFGDDKTMTIEDENGWYVSEARTAAGLLAALGRLACA